MVLVSSDKFANGLGLDVHIRTTIRDDWSYISGVAIRIGDDILEVHSFGKHYLNGVEDATIPKKFAGFNISRQVPKVPRRPMQFVIHASDAKINIRVFNDFVGVNMQHPTVEGFKDSVGLMGAFETGAWVMRNGETVIDPNRFGSDWQVQGHEHQLFVEEGTIKWPQACLLPTPTKEARRRLEESSITQEVSEEACAHWIQDKDICIHDVLLTHDLDIAVAGAY